MSKKDKRIKELEGEVLLLRARAKRLNMAGASIDTAYVNTIAGLCHTYGQGPNKEIHIPDQVLEAVMIPGGSVYRTYDHANRWTVYGIKGN